MNLDEQLRAALDQEADMQRAPAPDVDRLISGGRVRRRRRSLAQVGVAAAVGAVLVGVGVYGVTQLDSGDAAEPAQPAPTTTTPQAYISGEDIHPGTYRMLVGVDDVGVAIETDLTFYSDDWGSGSNFPVLSDGTTFGGVAVYRPTALAAGTGCLSDEPNSDLPGSPQALAQQLAQLPRSTVVEPPTPVQAFGRDAVHLQVRIDNDCGADEGYRLAETVRGSHGISFGVSPAMVVVDFWVVEVQGVPVVIDTWHDEAASSGLVDEVDKTGESTAFVTEG